MSHFITNIHVDHVRHLENIDIPLNPEKRTHLILTGKNGSGKTSVLEALKANLQAISRGDWREFPTYHRAVKRLQAALAHCTSADEKRKLARQLWLWSNRSAELLHQLDGHTSKVGCVAVTMEGLAVSGSWDKTLRVWNTCSGECLRVLKGHTWRVNCVAVTADELAISGSDDNTLRVWDIHSGDCLRVLTGHTRLVSCVAVTEYGLAVSGSADGTLRVWDIRSGECLHELRGHTNTVSCVAVTKEGFAVSGSWDKSLRVWDIRSGKCLRVLEGHTDLVSCVAVTEDGLAVSGSRDGTLRVWNTRSGECLRVLNEHTNEVSCVAVTEDGLAVSGSWDKTLRAWDMHSGECLHVLKGHTDLVRCVAVTEDVLAVSGSDDNTLRVWEPRSGECLHVLEGHTRRASCVAATEGGLAVSGSWDSTLRVWKTRTRRATADIDLSFNDEADLESRFRVGQFITAFFPANRLTQISVPHGVEDVKLAVSYTVDQQPVRELVKYLVHLKTQQAYAINERDTHVEALIKDWFGQLEKAIRKLMDDDSVTLQYDYRNYNFLIHQAGRDPFGFNELSDGFSAAICILADLLLRMDQNWLIKGSELDKTLEGVVLIDEIETHLHLELQRTILPFLTELFPNLQFIVTTHSPFVVSSLDNAVIYDLENRTLVKNGLTNASYEGVVEGYFRADALSEKLRASYERYKELVQRPSLTDDEYEEVFSLEQYLDEIPDYLTIGIATEYKRLKLEFRRREDAL